MTNTHQLILDKLNTAFENEPSIENAKKLATFVDTEIPNEVIKVLKERETVKTLASTLILLCGGVIGVFFSSVSGKTVGKGRENFVTRLCIGLRLFACIPLFLHSRILWLMPWVY